MKVKSIKPGDKNPLIAVWKNFFIHIDLYRGKSDERYDEAFGSALRGFQTTENIKAHGIIDNLTWFCGLKHGLQLNAAEENLLPLKPDFRPLTDVEITKYFGKLEFVPEPLPGNKEHIRIVNNYDKRNIIFVPLPQLAAATGGAESGMLFHKNAADQLKAFFSDIEKHGLLKMIRTFNGSFVPRLVRKSKKRISRHSFGTAFDVNARWNPMGYTPAALDCAGSVRELVPLAHEYGFYWGGHFSRKDGMHFEIAKIL